QPDLVADGDVIHGRNLEVLLANLGVGGQIGLRARLADFGNSDNFELLNILRNSGVGRAITDSDLLADREQRIRRRAATLAASTASATSDDARHRHVG